MSKDGNFIPSILNSSSEDLRSIRNRAIPQFFEGMRRNSISRTQFATPINRRNLENVYRDCHTDSRIYRDRQAKITRLANPEFGRIYNSSIKRNHSVHASHNYVSKYQFSGASRPAKQCFVDELKEEIQKREDRKILTPASKSSASNHQSASPRKINEPSESIPLQTFSDHSFSSYNHNPLLSVNPSLSDAHAGNNTPQRTSVQNKSDFGGDAGFEDSIVCVNREIALVGDSETAFNSNKEMVEDQGCVGCWCVWGSLNLFRKDQSSGK